MIITDEPGYYKENVYGIRIENIMLVKKHNKYEGHLEFEPLTLVPYCNMLILKKELEKRHIKAIKRYYKRIESEVIPILEK